MAPGRVRGTIAVVAGTLLAGTSLATTSCGDDDDDGSGVVAGTLMPGQFCAPDYPQMCTTGVCEDVLSGKLVEGGSATDYDQEGNEGTICTKPCSSRGDCTGIDFAAANETRVQTQTWSCSNDVCALRITPIESSSGDVCDGCGGALCSGDCIGCPQCR